MRKVAVFLHGNPGGSIDFSELMQHLSLGSDTDILMHERPREGALISDVIKGLEARVFSKDYDQVYVIAYSWGCYLAGVWLTQTVVPIEKIIFICPTLVAENPIKPIVNLLSRMPLLGPLLLKRKAPRLANEFIEKCFSPLKANVVQHHKMMSELHNPAIWRGAIDYKFQQQSQAMPKLDMDADRLIIVRGLEDKSTTWSIQKQCLNKVVDPLANAQLNEISGVGHALMWSDSEHVAELINNAVAGG
ncbi:MAG: alpha/beta hydrolase [Methylococcaceae bacterium]